MLLNAAKYQDYSFYRFLVIKGKPTGGKITPSHSALNFFLSTSVEMVDLEGIKDKVLVDNSLSIRFRKLPRCFLYFFPIYSL